MDLPDATQAIRLDARRRRFRRYVGYAVAACVLVIVTGLVRRSLAASRESELAAFTPSAAFTTMDRALGSAASELERAAARGTVRIDARSLKRGVWIDGARVTSASVVLPCGAHDVKIGAKGKARSLALPCGGEASIGR